jgi:uncharacterized DUF497 family protein
LDWDEDKAQLNRAQHGIGFRTASRVFEDEGRLTRADTWHSDDETRFQTVGWVPAPTWDLHGWYVFVVWTVRGEVIRLISARRATRAQRRRYEAGGWDDD